MAIVVAQEVLARRYEARLFSLASLFHFACYVALIIIPFVISYTSQSLWIMEKTGREQPEVHFHHEVLVVAQGAHPSQRFAFSSSAGVNALFGDALRAVSVRLSEADENDDGRPEFLHLEVSIPLRPGEDIVGLTVLAALDYSLQDNVRFGTNATAIVQYAGGVAGSGLQFWGDLELHAARALPPFTSSAVGPPTLAGALAATTADALAPAALISRYMAFPTAVHVAPRYPVWLVGGGGSRFTANVTLAVRPAVVRYQPRVAEMLKWGWVQYLSFFIPLWFALRQIKWFAAVSQITPCRVVVDRPHVRKINDHDF
ncbi:hypothetical protein KFE25_002836 [Diacronema lutheri]|uniref:Transmembrane protein 231 n=1 Tax=Diacronema lutheri TaxID=2081491 RepID=A0A8J5XS16_DIALT|nr:hypothetical protein KFE25_002836 [Diacronema lutheri]